MRKLLASALGLVLGLAALGVLAPPPRDPAYDALARIRHDCEVLFIGPSYVNSQVLPDVIDEEARRLGTRLHSCKFARTHLKGFELKRELGIILAQPWPALRLVIFDVTLGPDSRFTEENRFKPRVLRWHTWHLLPWYVTHRAGQRLKGQSYWGRFAEHARHVLVNALLVGRGAEHLAQIAPALVVAQKPPGEKKAPAISRRLALKNAKLIGRLRERRRRQDYITRPLPLLRWVQELRGVTRQHGTEGDGLIAPVWAPSSIPVGRLPEADRPVVHAFDDPVRYPQLYAAGMHTRSEHLTLEGSREYSRLLGQMLVKRMEQIK